jgi:hypothetical protein
MEKFKYGPLIYNCVNEEDDSGNYYWPGEPPVGYDKWGVPVDRYKKQVLPLSCPFHPFYDFPETRRSKVVNTVTLPTSLKCYFDWCEENFVKPNEMLFKKDVCKKVIKRMGINLTPTPKSQRSLKLLKEEIMKLGNT